MYKCNVTWMNQLWVTACIMSHWLKQSTFHRVTPAIILWLLESLVKGHLNVVLFQAILISHIDHAGNSYKSIIKKFPISR